MTDILERAVDTSWQERAACLNEDPELFWIDPESGDNALTREKRAAAARRICADCPVLADCTLWGILVATSDKWSVLGGLTHRQRKRIRSEIGWK